MQIIDLKIIVRLLHYILKIEKFKFITPKSYLTKDGDFLGASRNSFRKQESMAGGAHWFFKARPVVSVANVTRSMLKQDEKLPLIFNRPI